MRKLERLEENLASVSVVLTPDDLDEIDQASANIEMQGARYPEEILELSRL